MIVVKAVFDHIDGQGRLLLSDLAVHAETPFAQLVGVSERVVFVDGDQYVEGRVVDVDGRRWAGFVEWDTQGEFLSYPSDRRRRRLVA